MKGNFHKPRTRTIFETVEDYLGSSNDSFQTFCMHVVEDYVSNVSPQNIEFSQNSDSYKRIELNAQKIRRMMDDRFPADLEESFVAALPDEYRTPLLSKLAARYGLIATPMPSGEADHTTNLARLCKEFADVVQTKGRLIADGTLNNDSQEDRDYAEQQVNELIAELTGWKMQLQQAKQPELQVVHQGYPACG